MLYKHDEVREVAFGGAPDEYRGETVIAFIVASEDVSDHLREELKELYRAQLVAYKVPNRIVIQDELPKNFNGKIIVSESRKKMDLAG